MLLLTARLAGLPLRRRRYLLVSLLGGLYAVAVFLPGCAFLSTLTVKCAVGILMALIAFGREERLFRLTALFFMVSSASAGSVLAFTMLAGEDFPLSEGIFYIGTSFRLLILTMAGVYLILSVFLRASAKFRIEGRLIPIRIGILGRVSELTALVDSGNGLQDGGAPVIVLSEEAAARALPGRVQPLLRKLSSPAELLEPLMLLEPALRPRLIPYRAVGVRSGLLLSVECEWVEAAGERCRGVRAALCPGALGDGYHALLDGNWGRRHGNCSTDSSPADTLRHSAR